jgi:uncharacterized protein YcbK (DUF882 family)
MTKARPIAGDEYVKEHAMTAALEAQAEANVRSVERDRGYLQARIAGLESVHAAKIAEQAEEHTRAVGEVQAHWLGKFSSLREKHAAELAEKNQMHMAAMQAKEQYYIQKMGALRGEGEAALIHFEHHALHRDGAACMIHRDYLPTMRKLCGIASDCEVELFITSSYRTLHQDIEGAIVKAARRSNHYAGSAVDLNVVCGKGWFNSERLSLDGDLGGLPHEHPVGIFIDAVREALGIRWGGDFAHKDPVQFDSDLVRRDPAEWQRRVEQLRGET